MLIVLWRKTSSEFTGFSLHGRPLRVAIGGVVSQQRQQRAQSAERRPTTAFASTLLTQSVTQHNISPSQHPHLTARRTRSTSSSKHPFHNCLPSSAHRRQQACSSTACFFFCIGSDYFLCLHLYSPRWFYVLIAFYKDKQARDAEHHRFSAIISSLSRRSGKFAFDFGTYSCWECNNLDCADLWIHYILKQAMRSYL